MKTAKAIVHKFDVVCPHCGEFINANSYDVISWSIYELVPTVLKCQDCGQESKAPAQVKGTKITRGES